MARSFDLVLARVIAWCALRADPGDPVNSLRSQEMRPKLLDDRRHLMEDFGAGRPWAMDDLQGGRLLLYFPDEDLADGVAEAESAGFFDFYSTPPWDTWVAFLGEDVPASPSGPYLISWVPPPFIDLAAAGIQAHPIDECLCWLDDADVPLRADLRRRGVLP